MKNVTKSLIFLVILILFSRSEIIFGQYLSIYTSENYLPKEKIDVNVYVGGSKESTLNVKLFHVEDIEQLISEIKNYDENKFKIENLDFLKLIDEEKIYLEISKSSWSSKTITFDKYYKPGVYFIYASSGKLKNYAMINISELGWVIKKDDERILFYTVNRITSKPKSTELNLIFKDNDKQIKINNPTGITEIKTDNILNKGEVFLIIKTNTDEVLLRNSISTYQNNYDKNKVYIYTNAPVYRPGFDVKLKLIAKQLKDFNYVPIDDGIIKVTVINPKDEKIFTKEFSVNKFGSADGYFKLDDNAKLGDYRIEAELKGNIYYGNFSVEEYKKPEYKVEINVDKKQYSQKDKISATVSANYYFGSPVTNAKVEYEIYKTSFYRPWWYYDPYSYIYRHCYWDYYIPQKDFIDKGEGEIDKDGKFKFEYELSENTDRNYEYSIVAKVTDQSRREIESSVNFFVTKGEFQIITNPLKYVYKPKERITIQVRAVDFGEKPIQTKFKVYINKNNFYLNENLLEEIDTLEGETGKDGLGFVYWNSETNGVYTYKVKVEDSKKNNITATGNFWVSDENKYMWNANDVQIIADKDGYAKGETITALILTPVENCKLLFTMESNKLISYEILNVEGYSSVYRIKLNKDLPSLMNLRVAFYFDNDFYQGEKKIAILPDEKLLSIKINPNKKTYKPKEIGKYVVEVLDKKNKPVPNCELSIGIMDESVYAIKEESVEKISEYFIDITQNYIYTNYLYVYNRNRIYDEGKLNELFKEELKLKGNGKISGLLTYEDDEKQNFGSIIAILIKDKKGITTGIDLDGSFEFENIEEGKYDLVIKNRGDDYYSSRILGKIIRNIYIKENQKLNLGKILIEQVSSYDRIRTYAKMSESYAPTMDMKKMNVQETAMDGMGVGEPKKEYAELKIRSDFKDAIFWEPSLITDKNGKAKFEVNFPDNLTTWRTTIRANNLVSQFGQDTNKIITRKNLLIRMEVPRVIREKDKATISTIIHNYLDNTKEVKIGFKIKNGKLLDSYLGNRKDEKIKYQLKNGEYFVMIDKNSEVRINWNILIEEPLKEAILEATAMSDEESDGIELKVPIQPLGVEMVSANVLSLSDDDNKKEFSVVIPKEINLKSSSVMLSLSPSIAGVLLGALDDLIGYPYGCVEQTMSRFLPALIVQKTMNDLNIKVKEKSLQDLPKIINTGLNRLYDFQHLDGGWGWWTNDQTNPYMTAYVIFGLSITKNLGYDIDEQKYESGVNQLKELIFNNNSDDDNIKAYMIFALSQVDKNLYKDDLGKIEKLIKKIEKNKSAYVNSLITIATKNFGLEDLSKQNMNKLIRNAINERNNVYWGTDKNNYRWQEDNMQITALAIKALLLDYKNNSDLVEKAIRWLMIKRKGSSWISTVQTALVIYSLSDYLKLTNELEPDYHFKIKINDSVVYEKDFTSADVFLKETKITIDYDKLKLGDNKIEVEKSGKGKLYLSSLLKYFSKDQLATPIDDIFSIDKKYYLITDVESDGKIVKRLRKYEGFIKPGDELFVKIKIKSKNSQDYFMLEEPIPSGFEVVKESDNYRILGEKDYDNYRPIWRWFYADREVHDDRITFFVTELSKGEFDFSYIIRAQIPGEYVVLPSMGLLMYYPEVRGTSKASDVKIVE